MDQEKIGKFIAQRRKAGGYTQAALAERLGITDRAVSKWETGRSLPDVSIMPELCGLLDISVNELLSGERLDMDKYKHMAEEHLIEMRAQEEAANRRLLSLEWVIGVMGTLGFFMGMFAGSYAVTDPWWRAALYGVGTLMLLGGGQVALKLEQSVGYYECPECGERYVPTMWAVFIAPHFGRTRRMKCPKCGAKAYQKKVLTK